MVIHGFPDLPMFGNAPSVSPHPGIRRKMPRALNEELRPGCKKPEGMKTPNCTCLVCGSEFYSCPQRLKIGGRFCSKKCQGKWRSEHLTGERSSRWKGGNIKKACLWCGKIMFVKQYKEKIGEGKFCSRFCSGKFNSISLFGEKNPAWKGGGKEKRKCQVCGGEFITHVCPSRTRNGKGKFCSVSCRSLSANKNMKTKDTGIEIKTESILQSLGVVFEKQKIIREAHTIADFYIPTQHLVIYADGFYWHKSKSAEEKGVPRKDMAQDFLLTFNGYRVLRLCENKINDNPKWCKREITKALSSFNGDLS